MFWFTEPSSGQFLKKKTQYWYIQRVRTRWMYQYRVLRIGLRMVLWTEICRQVFTRVADKFLARLGRKQATANKLRIFATHSPRSSIHFLARCSNFCKSLKKKSEGCPSNRVSTAAMTSASDEKWRHFNCIFQSREQVVVRRGQIRRIGWVIKKSEAQIGQFFLSCKCPVSRGIVVQEQDPLGDLPAAFFSPNVLHLHQQRWIILRVNSLAL